MKKTPAERITAFPYDGTAAKENNTLGKKLSEARKTMNLSQKELSDMMASYKVKAAAGSISKWEKGDAMPNPYQLFALCYCLQISDVLPYFTGNAPESYDYSPELSQKGLNLLQLFKNVLISSGQYAPRSRNSFNADPEPEFSMKVYDEPAAAGPGTEDVLGSYEMISFPVSSIPENADFGVRVSGISMLPRYVDRQIVWVENCLELYNGDIGVFFYDGKAYIKKYVLEMPSKDDVQEYLDTEGRLHQKITLQSLNRECADLDVTVRLGHEFSIVGRVLN